MVSWKCIRRTRIRTRNGTTTIGAFSLPEPTSDVSMLRTTIESIDDCIHTICQSWRAAVNAPTVADAPLNEEPVSAADGVTRPPGQILEQNRPGCLPHENAAGFRVVDNTWTHLVTHPQHARSRVLDKEDARDLYSALSLREYQSMGMGVMEPFLSAVTRFSLRVVLWTTSTPKGI